MGTQGKRGTGSQAGPRRNRIAVLRQDECLHTNAGIVAVPEAGQGGILIACPECGRTATLTDRSAGAVLALLDGGI